MPRPRSDIGTWQALNSCGYSPPTPMPSTTRPPVARSTSLTCLATMAAGNNGSSTTTVPITAVSDTADSRASDVSVSGTGFSEDT